MELKIGSVVRANAGRDKDSFFVVTAAEKNCCFIADGKSRKLSSPKRKSIKHLSFTGNVIDLNDITDKKLRKVLGEYSHLTD